MKKVLLGSVMSAALLFSTGMVLAQAVIEFTPQQERSVYTNIYGQRVITETTPQFEVTVGTVLPGEVQLYEVPATVEYAPAREYRYVTVGNRVVLVEPASRKVIRVIAPPSEVERDKVR
jgi:Protein of unknown function (DUF1236)